METLRIRVGIRTKDIAYFRGTLESYDGMAVVRTIDPAAAAVEVQIAPGCERFVFEVMDDLKNNEGLQLAFITVPEREPVRVHLSLLSLL